MRPAATRGRMNTVLAKFLDIFIVVYLDDVMIFSDLREACQRCQAGF